ncbi:MAG: MarR family winged helix-turn-helix transcriptional regulator [Lactobacillales bacterium]|jgi:DNA-binding MarR family transcriptional regulator|nr:MarR family winged helix-turn-helix transcriptional regulator [Lactobacillales bacterium]
MERGKVAFEIRDLMISISRYKENSIRCQEADFPKLYGIQVATLLFLLKRKERETFQKDIEEQFHVRRPTATNMIKRMEANGLIYREPVSYDARLKRIVLAEKAYKYQKWMEKSSKVFQEKMVQDIPDEEISMFISTLRKIQKNMEV